MTALQPSQPCIVGSPGHVIELDTKTASEDVRIVPLGKQRVYLFVDRSGSKSGARGSHIHQLSGIG